MLGNSKCDCTGIKKLVQIGSEEVYHVHNCSSRVTVYLVVKDYERVESTVRRL